MNDCKIALYGYGNTGEKPLAIVDQQRTWKQLAPNTLELLCPILISMSHTKASEVATAINGVMRLDGTDKTSMLEVISDYFTMQDPDSDDSDCSDLEEDGSTVIDVHTQSKINTIHHFVSINYL